MIYYAALDVSLRSVHVCVIDEQGEIKAEAKLPSEVEDIVTWLQESGPPDLSGWTGSWHPDAVSDLWFAGGRLRGGLHGGPAGQSRTVCNA